MGSGGVGGYFGAKLLRAGVEVTMVARGPHLEAIRRAGLTIRSAVEGESIVRPAAVERLEGVARANAVLSAAIARGIEQGEFRDVDPQRAAYLAVAPLLIAAMWRHSFGRCTSLPFEPGSYLEHHLDVFLRGLERRPEEGAQR